MRIARRRRRWRRRRRQWLRLVFQCSLSIAPIGVPTDWYEVVRPYHFAIEHQYERGWNRGVDVRARGGSARAIAGGRVAFSGLVAGRGVVTVRSIHPNFGPVVVTYTGVRPGVRVGQVVAPGSVLGRAAALHVGMYDAHQRSRYLPLRAREPLVAVRRDGSISSGMAGRLRLLIEGGGVLLPDIRVAGRSAVEPPIASISTVSTWVALTRASSIHAGFSARAPGTTPPRHIARSSGAAFGSSAPADGAVESRRPARRQVVGAVSRTPDAGRARHLAHPRGDDSEASQERLAQRNNTSTAPSADEAIALIATQQHGLITTIERAHHVPHAAVVSPPGVHRVEIEGMSDTISTRSPRPAGPAGSAPRGRNMPAETTTGPERPESFGARYKSWLTAVVGVLAAMMIVRRGSGWRFHRNRAAAVGAGAGAGSSWARAGEFGAATRAYFALHELLEVPGLAAEHALVGWLGENDALALYVDFQWVALANGKSFSDLDWNDNSTQFVDLSNDSCVLHQHDTPR